MREQHGIRTFKIKVGRDVETDLAAVRAVRDALPDAELYVDANRGWSYEDALRAGDALIDLGVAAIEEPIATDDRRGRARLAERWQVPFLGDESCISLAHVARELDDGAVGMVSVKSRAPASPSRAASSACASAAPCPWSSARSTRAASAR